MRATSFVAEPAAASWPPRRPQAPSACFLSIWPQGPTHLPSNHRPEEIHRWVRPRPQSAPSASMCPRTTSSTSADASSRPGGPKRRPSPMKSQCVRLATSQKLARYWATECDWRRVQERLNALPQFITGSTGWTFISFTSGRNMKRRCRSSSATDGPGRSSSSCKSSIHLPIPQRTAPAHRTPSTS